jgi:hypothetical protein
MLLLYGIEELANWNTTTRYWIINVSIVIVEEIKRAFLFLLYLRV